ncbi:hypothetical protein B0J14DRAFT_355184 [Halenospora varia]|nr:hypothetical protein B0J14DRAFT_355184 [Halenospora varia]
MANMEKVPSRIAYGQPSKVEIPYGNQIKPNTKAKVHALMELKLDERLKKSKQLKMLLAFLSLEGLDLNDSGDDEDDGPRFAVAVEITTSSPGQPARPAAPTSPPSSKRSAFSTPSTSKLGLRKCPPSIFDPARASDAARLSPNPSRRVARMSALETDATSSRSCSSRRIRQMKNSSNSEQSTRHQQTTRTKIGCGC